MSLIALKMDRAALANAWTQSEDAKTTLTEGLLNGLADFNRNLSQINSMTLLKQVISLYFVCENKSCDKT